MELIKAIKQRQSIRNFLKISVNRADINVILDAGRYAPSGLNNQPWRYIVIQNSNTIEKLATCTKYSNIVKNAPLLIAVFLDSDASYNYIKDIQAIGASIQNMLLVCVELNLGSVWLGEILNRKEMVNLILDVPESFELMAILAIGHPDKEKMHDRKPRKDIFELGFNEKFPLQWECEIK
ncbi:MAG: nitroreductase family protein [Methanosarcinaceae archaeon]|jgi:nitroreductase|nr:nitroreductase family protein [Methanosarcinaceae archaeon]NKQ38726.1 nitroreductase family protein [Methanosarcinales archaeon]